jgi:hypothetical protein
MFSTAQTKILGSTSLLALLLGSIFYATQYGLQKSGIFLLFALIPFAINIYTVHCVIFGKCTVYSWLLTLLLTLFAVAIIVIYGQLLLKKNEIAVRAKIEMAETASLQQLAELALGIPF